MPVSSVIRVFIIRLGCRALLYRSRRRSTQVARMGTVRNIFSRCVSQHPHFARRPLSKQSGRSPHCVDTRSINSKPKSASLGTLAAEASCRSLSTLNTNTRHQLARPGERPDGVEVIEDVGGHQESRSWVVSGLSAYPAISSPEDALVSGLHRSRASLM